MSDWYQISRKVKGTNGVPTKSKRRRRSNKNRKQDRRNEGEDNTTRRNAQELGVTFPTPYCDKNSTIPHYWIKIENSYDGVLFQCKKCYNYLWLPVHQSDTIQLDHLMHQHGRDEGYCIYLNHASRRATKIHIAKLQRLYKLSSNITNSLQFAKEVDKVLSDKEYDKYEQLARYPSTET